MKVQLKDCMTFSAENVSYILEIISASMLSVNKSSLSNDEI